MVLSGLVGAPVQVDPLTSVVIFVVGLVLLAGILYYFAKHTK